MLEQLFLWCQSRCFFVCVSHDLTSSVCQPTSMGLPESVHMTKSASQGTRDEVVEMQSSVGHDGCIGSCVSLVQSWPRT